MKKIRLDSLLVRRGLAGSRERAQALILAGKVHLNESRPVKPGTLLAEDAAVTLIEPDHPYVGRGALKLVHALDEFGMVITGRDGLDIGASTGGFTEVLLQRGAHHVVALDVGHGLLDWKLRTDRRVTVVEGVNARTLTPELLPVGLRQFDLVTIDVSFISLRLILPVLPPLLKPSSDLVVLVKPQFEAGRHEVGKGGIVRDAAIHDRVIREVSAAANQVGLSTVAMTPSPILGVEGNREFFLHLRLAPRASG